MLMKKVRLQMNFNSVKFVKRPLVCTDIIKDKAYPVKRQLTNRVFEIMDEQGDKINVSLRSEPPYPIAELTRHYGWVVCDENGKEVKSDRK